MRRPVIGRAESFSDFNSRTSCEVRLRKHAQQFSDSFISTHAPLARCDHVRLQITTAQFISTHAPLARCDTLWGWWNQLKLFQLTHLLRGATFCRLPQIWRCISTHAPLARCDLSVCSMHLTLLYFNSRTSCEVRPCCSAGFRLPRHFNSRTSCEVRQCVTLSHAAISPFQLTHLLRGATRSSSAFVLAFKFQLTHLLRGATWAEFVREDGENNFNSRTSCEVRPRRDTAHLM